MPLFAASYPANAEFFSQMLLEVAAFDAIPAEEINSHIWNDALEPSNPEIDNDIGNFEKLGYQGPYVLLNLTSTLIMLLLALFVLLAILLPSLISCCCKCCRN